MNNSGEAVQAISHFYGVDHSNLLVIHDELDLNCGKVRLKQEGGHGGHNGIRNIIKHLGTGNFLRLRIGIGHPGHKDKVLSYVLNKPSSVEKASIQQAIDKGLTTINYFINGTYQKAMKILHTEGKDHGI